MEFNPALSSSKTIQNLFWGVVTSMYIGNVMLLVLNLPLIGLWVRVLKGPLQYSLSSDPDLLHYWCLQSKK